jgi:glycosyltransferase involved in cell wall biosynthesis
VLRFSILISNCNHARLVGAAVDSCLAQDFAAERFEVVVVDDGSTDDSLLALARFRDHPQVKLIEQANAGQAAAFATALAASHGELICLLDPDDLFEPGKLSALDAAMGGIDDGLLCHDLEVFEDASGQPIGHGWWRHAGVPSALGILKPAHLLDAPHPFPFSVPCGLVCGRRLLERALRSVSMAVADWRVSADNVLAWSLLLLGGQVRYLPKMLARYRIHAANTFMTNIDGVLQGRRAWQRSWPVLHAHLRALLEDSGLRDEERRTWEELLRRFEPIVGDAATISPTGELPDRAALADWARALLASGGAAQGNGVEDMEAWARSLLGLAFLGEEAGAEAWRQRRARLASGVDPAAADGWGRPVDHDQRIVELADIALSLCLAPAHLWDPLPENAKRAVLDYLRAGFDCEVYPSNWLWFRVAIGVALERFGARPDRSRMHADLDRLESYAAGNGWYRDGAVGPCDYYNAWGFHFHALLYTKLDPKAEPARCERLRERAARFGREYLHWFAPNGASLAYGRSVVYRFAAAAYWAVAAWAGIEALPQGELKGLLLRNLRWWKARLPAVPLAIGYTYPNPRVAEFYSSAGSLYEVAKAFAALLMPASHEFWRAPELPQRYLEPRPQPEPGLLFWRTDLGSQVNALCAGIASPVPQVHRQSAYARFCYSTHFGFGTGEESVDGALVFSEDGVAWHWRGRSERQRVEAGFVYSEWRPLPDVLVRSWLLPAGAWHVRIHAVQSLRPLLSLEGGFALGHDGSFERQVLAGQAFARSTLGGVGAIELAGARQAELLVDAPNANLMHRATVIPALRGRHGAGTSWLVGAFLGARSGMKPPPPRASASGNGYEVLDAGGKVLIRLTPTRS